MRKSKMRKSWYPNKRKSSTSFCLTKNGRGLLCKFSEFNNISQGDVLETLIRGWVGPILFSGVPQSGPRGGMRSYFFGKNRRTSTSPYITQIAHDRLRALHPTASRGDVVEHLLTKQVKQSLKLWRISLTNLDW